MNEGSEKLSNGDLVEKIAHDYYWHRYYANQIEHANSILFKANLRIAAARSVYVNRNRADRDRLEAVGNIEGGQRQISHANELLARGHIGYAKNLILAERNFRTNTTGYIEQAIEDAESAGKTIVLEQSTANSVLGIMSLEELQFFAESQEESGSKKLGTRVFNALSRTSVLKDWDERFAELDYYSMDLDLLNQLQEEDILRVVPGFGPKAAKLISEFIEYRRQQIQEQA